MDLLRSGAYHFLDRGAPGLTPEDIGKIYRQIFPPTAICLRQRRHRGGRNFECGRQRQPRGRHYLRSRQCYPRGGLQQNRERPCRRRRPCQGRCRAGKCQTPFLQNALRRYRPVRKPAKVPAASAAHTCCTATSACRAASRSSSWARSWATEPEPQRQKGRVLFSTRPFLFSISNLPCRLRHTKTYRNGRWVPCRSFTLPSSACGQGRAGGLRSPHIGLRAPFKWLVGLNIWRIKSHRAGCLPVYWPPLRSMSYNSSRRRANMSLTS